MSYCACGSNKLCVPVAFVIVDRLRALLVGDLFAKYYIIVIDLLDVETARF